MRHREVTRVIPYKPLLDAAIDLCSVRPQVCVIVQRPQGPAALTEGMDIGWDELMGAEPACCVTVAATTIPLRG